MRLILALSALLAASPALAQNKQDDPLDRALLACLDSAAGQTTAGMVDCQATAVAGWDKRLNEIYQQAMKTLDPKSAGLLRISQRNWLAFRNAEQASLAGPWRDARGTIMSVEVGAAILSALKERVSELRLYIGDEN